MDDLFKALEQAKAALHLAQGLYQQYLTAKETMSETDQQKLKTKLAELQLEYDGLHDSVQKKLRG